MPQVYSFGIVLLELVTSQMVDDKIHKRILKATKMGTEPQGLKEWLDSAGGPWPEDVEVRHHPTEGRWDLPLRHPELGPRVLPRLSGPPHDPESRLITSSYAGPPAVPDQQLPSAGGRRPPSDHA